MSGRVPRVADVLRGRPKTGPVDGAQLASAYAARVRADAVFCATAVGAAQTELRQLRSSAVTRLAERLHQGALPGARSLEESARKTASALNSFSRSVEHIHLRADRIRQAAADSLTGIDRSMAQIAGICDAIVAPFWYAWNTPPRPSMPMPSPAAVPVSLDATAREASVFMLWQAYEVRWRNAALEWESDVDAVASAAQRWAGLVEERRGVEHALAAALRDTAVGQLLTLGADTPVGRRRTIAAGLTGGSGSISRLADAVKAEHPLLAGIFIAGDASAAWNAPPEPHAVAMWWESLDEGERETLVREVPFVVGNLPGVPARWRDAANRRSVEFFRAHPELLGPEQLRLVAEVQRILDVERAQTTAKPEIQVYSLNLLESVPMVAVAYGDLDTATHTTWQVSGINSDAPVALPMLNRASQNLFEEQTAVLQRSGGGAPAVLAWLSYDTPKLPPDLGVLRPTAAAAGAARLSAEIDGLHVARVSGDHGVPVNNVIAHSYGTTLASIALTHTTYPVDSFVMLGSAGLDHASVPSIDSLNVREVEPGQKAVYATTATADKIAPAGAGLSTCRV